MKMRTIRRAAWKAARGAFTIVAVMAFMLLYPFGVIVDMLEDTEIMTTEEKREYYGYSRRD